MKKVYVMLAVAALTLCAASCGNKNKKAQEGGQEATECCTKAEGECCNEEGGCCKSAVEEVKDAAVEAVKDVAEEGINTAAEAAKNAVK